MVLEAWEWAEKVWYPVIWEERKDASNVIDYAINKEITIDTNATWNANNETTTWQATLVYWVNAPKIIQSTSVYDKNYNQLWDIQVSYSRYISVPSWWSVSYIDYNLNLVSLDWIYNFQIWSVIIWWTIYKDSIIYIPENWIYNIKWTFNSADYCTTTVYARKNEYPWELLWQASKHGNATWTIDLTVNLQKMDYVWFDYKAQMDSTWIVSFTHYLNATITKIW